MRWLGLLFGIALTAALAAAETPPAGAQESGKGCLVLESVGTHQGTCTAEVRNSCSGALQVTAAFEVELWRWKSHDIPPRPAGADHEGEPAAGHYEPAGKQTGEKAGLLAAAASRAFDYKADGEDSLIVGCKVRLKSTPAS